MKRSIVRLTTGRRALDRAFGFVVSFTERSFDPGVKLSNTYLSNLSAVFRDADGIHARIQSTSVELFTHHEGFKTEGTEHLDLMDGRYWLRLECRVLVNRAASIWERSDR